MGVFRRLTPFQYFRRRIFPFGVASNDVTLTANPASLTLTGGTAALTETIGVTGAVIHSPWIWDLYHPDYR